MHPVRRPLLALSLLFLAATGLADDLEEVRRLDREITVATWTADPTWFEENVAEDFVLITPTGSKRTKRDVINELATPGLKMEPYEPAEVQVRMYGDTAIVTGRILQKYTLGGIRFANNLRYTDVYVKRKGRWMLVSGHTSAVAVRR